VLLEFEPFAPPELEEPELEEEAVNSVSEFGVITIVTGSPLLSVALTRKEPGTIWMLENP
jgi:hypothetical protein